MKKIIQWFKNKSQKTLAQNERHRIENERYRIENERLQNIILSMETDLQQKFKEYMKDILVYGEKPKMEIKSYSHSSCDEPVVVETRKIFIPSFEIAYMFSRESDKKYIYKGVKNVN